MGLLSILVQVECGLAGGKAEEIQGGETHRGSAEREPLPAHAAWVKHAAASKIRFTEDEKFHTDVLRHRERFLNRQI